MKCVRNLSNTWRKQKRLTATLLELVLEFDAAYKRDLHSGTVAYKTLQIQVIYMGVVAYRTGTGACKVFLKNVCIRNDMQKYLQAAQPYLHAILRWPRQRNFSEKFR
jgi:hypothetical protein